MDWLDFLNPWCRIRSIRTFHALADSSFRCLWAAGWFWYVCRMMEMVVMSWLVLELTDSPGQVALAGSIRMAPMLLFGPVGGVLADRLPQKRLMIGIQLMNVLAVLPMAGLASSGLLAPWHVFISTFLVGTAQALDFSVRRAYFSRIFDSSNVTNAVALDATSFMGSAMVGPFLGGILVAVVGFGGAYVVMVSMFSLSVVVLLFLKEHEPANDVMLRSNIFSETINVVHLARHNPTVWATVVLTVAFNFFGGPYMQMVPVIARDVLGVGSVRYGILAASPGLGALAGALAIATRGVQRQGQVFSLGAGLMLIAVFFFALSPIYLLSIGLVFLAGIGVSGFATMQVALVLRSTPEAERGSAMGAVALGIGTSPFGILLVGFMAELFGVQAALAFLTASGAVVVLMLRWRFPLLRD